MTDPGGQQQGAGQTGGEQGQQDGQQDGGQQGGGEPVATHSPATTEAQLYSQDYVSTLRGEAANYRTQRNTYRDALRGAGLLDEDGNLQEAQNRQRGRQQQSEQEGPSQEAAQLRTENERLQTQMRRDRTERRASELVTTLGGKPERATYISRLANLDDLRFDEAGRPDEVQLQERITTVLNELPELRVGAGSVGGGGSNPAGGQGNDPEKNPWAKEHFNLSEQGRLYTEDPQKATRLAKQAGITLG